MTELYKASFWSYVLNWSQQGIVSITSFVIAALLGPEKFGLITISMVLVIFCQMLSEQGLIVGIVQKDDLKKKHIDTSFFCIIVICLILTVICILSAPAWSYINDMRDVELIILVLSPLILVRGVGIVPLALLRREMNFKHISIITNVSSICGGSCGIAVAFVYNSAWAIVVQHLIAEILMMVLAWRSCARTPSFRFSQVHFWEMWPVSSGAFVASVGDFVRIRADTILLGIALGPVAVGLFRMAVRILELVVNLFMRPMASVALPLFSRSQNEPGRFQSEFRKCVRAGAGITVPLLGAVSGLSEPILRLLGPDWATAAPALSILCIAGIVRCAMGFVPQVLNAHGRSYLTAIYNWAGAVTNAAALTAALYLSRGQDLTIQLNIAAASIVAVNVAILLPLSAKFLALATSLSAADLLRPLTRPSISAGLAFFSGWQLHQLDVFVGHGAVVELVAKGSFVAIAMVVSIYVFDKEIVKLLLSRVPAPRR